MAQGTAQSTAKAPIERPVSPHLQIYRWSWTMTMSVFHRVTGSALYVGTVLLAIWLVAMASGEAAYDAVAWFFGSILGRLILFGYTWALLHHMLGGVRHLAWDTGRLMEPGTRMAVARFTLIGSAALTLAVWIIAYLMR